MFNDVSIDALQAALKGLSARERAVSDDIANVNTPYFTGRRVSFENDLKAALNSGSDPRSVTPTTVATTDPQNLNFNNVDLTAETMLGVDTQLKFDLATRAVSDRFSLMRTAIGGA
jgi:flagellar basal-body rod protein FlgB